MPTPRLLQAHSQLQEWQQQRQACGIMSGGVAGIVGGLFCLCGSCVETIPGIVHRLRIGKGGNCFCPNGGSEVLSRGDTRLYWIQGQLMRSMCVRRSTTGLMVKVVSMTFPNPYCLGVVVLC